MRKQKIIGISNCGRFDIVALFVNGVQVGTPRRLRRLN
jgi:hypothetical protein